MVFKMIRKKFFLTTLTVIFALLFSGIGGISAYALDDTGKVQVEFKNGDTVYNNAEFVLYNVTDSDYLKNQPDISESGVVDIGKYYSLTAEKQKSISNELFEYCVKNNMAGINGITDSKGEVMFEKLPKGIYLLALEGEYSVGEEVISSGPVLFNLPYTFETDEEYMHLIINPKSESTPIEKPAEELPPQTGQHSNVPVFVCLLVACMLTDVFLILGKRRKHENEN